jgi:prepilin signal peptidase PulO-like enzyme (type II secretory pathway)
MDFFSDINLLPFSALISLVAIFGLIFGSFASLLSHRLSTNQTVVFSRSKCPKCHFKLTARNLIPLFSWIFQRGKCSNCKQKISIRYPLIELIMALSFVIIFLTFPVIDLRFILLCLISFVLIVMSITDLEHYYIPNLTQYLLVILIIFLRINDGGTYGTLTNLKAAFLYMGFGLLMLTFFYVTTKIEAIGIDDIKFFFIAGLLLGTNNFLSFMLLSGTLGTIFGHFWQRIRHDSSFPFGPSICVALYVCMLYGDKIDVVNTLGSLIF